MIRHVIRGFAQLVAVDNVGSLGVQLLHFLLVEPMTEAFYLGKLATRLQHHQDEHQAYQQVDWSKQTKGV